MPRLRSPVQPVTGNGMALLVGGRVDINFNRYMAFRCAADGMMVDSNGSSSKNFHVPTP